MQQHIIIILFIVAILFMTICIFCMIRMNQDKNRYKKLMNCMEYKNTILSENSLIRHDYNNIFQSLINMIEEENMAALISYKKTLVEKTRAISRNSLIQLARIKDNYLFYTIFLLYTESIAKGLDFNIYVFQEIKNEYPSCGALSKVLEDSVRSVNQKEIKNPIKINLYIRESGQEVCFRFDYEYAQESEIPDIISSKSNRMRKSDMTYNIFQKEKHIIQEIMFCNKS